MKGGRPRFCVPVRPVPAVEAVKWFPYGMCLFS